MHQFKDTEGRPWNLVINVAAIKRVRGLLKDDAGKPLDIYKLVEDGFKPLATLLADPCRFVDVLFVLCMEEADKRGVKDEDFGRAFSGDVIDNAATAFVEELTDFFPQAKVRDSLRKVTAATRKVQEKMGDKLAVMADALDPDRIMEEIMSKVAKSSPTSGSSPESLESTPALSHSAS